MKSSRVARVLGILVVIALVELEMRKKEPQGEGDVGEGNGISRNGEL